MEAIVYISQCVLLPTALFSFAVILSAVALPVFYLINLEIHPSISPNLVNWTMAKRGNTLYSLTICKYSHKNVKSRFICKFFWLELNYKMIRWTDEEILAVYAVAVPTQRILQNSPGSVYKINTVLVELTFRRKVISWRRNSTENLICLH